MIKSVQNNSGQLRVAKSPIHSRELVCSRVFSPKNILEKAHMKNFPNEENDSLDPQLNSIYIRTKKGARQYGHFTRAPQQSYLKHKKILPPFLLQKLSPTDCSSSNNPAAVGKTSCSYISFIMAYFLHTTAIATYVTVLSFYEVLSLEIFLSFVKCMSFQTRGYL